MPIPLIPNNVRNS